MIVLAQMNRLQDISIHRILFFLLIIFLPTQLGYHFWPEWSMVLGRRIYYLSPTLFTTDILLISCVGTWLIIQKQKLTTLHLFLNLHKIEIIVCIVFVVFNIFSSTHPFISLYGWFKCMEYIFFGIYIVKTKTNISEVFPFLSIAAFYSSLLGIFQTLHQSSIGGFLWFIGERSFTLSTPNIAKGTFCFPGSYSCISYLRPYATFSHPNVLAGFLTVFLIFALQLFFSSSVKFNNRYNFYKLFVSLTICLSTFTLLITYSRSAWLSLIIATTFIYFKKLRNEKLIISTLILLFIVCFVSLLSPLPFFDNESIDIRIALNQAAFTIIQHFPFFGTGLHTFLTVLPDYLPLRTVYFLQPVHNIYLLTLSEIGAIGLIILSWLIRKKFKMSPTLLALIFVGLFDHYLLTIQQGQLVLVLVTALSFL